MVRQTHKQQRDHVNVPDDEVGGLAVRSFLGLEKRVQEGRPRDFVIDYGIDPVTGAPKYQTVDIVALFYGY